MLLLKRLATYVTISCITMSGICRLVLRYRLLPNLFESGRYFELLIPTYIPFQRESCHNPHIYGRKYLQSHISNNLI